MLWERAWHVVEIKELASLRSAQGSDLSDNSATSPNVITSYRFDSLDPRGMKIQHSPRAQDAPIEDSGDVADSAMLLETRQESLRVLESGGHDLKQSEQRQA